jgi:Na+/H+-dicarboxylate symporter
MIKRKVPLHWQVIIGLVVGAIYAYFSIIFGWNEFTMDYIKPLGDIFINLLKLIAVPLVLFSIISGVISMKDIRQLGSMGAKTLGLYVITTMFSVALGLVAVNLVKPGTLVDDDLRKSFRVSYELWLQSDATIPRLDDTCLTCDPENEALVADVQQRENSGTGKSSETDAWVQDKLEKAKSTKEEGPMEPLVDIVPDNIFQSLADTKMLQIIFFAILFGVILVTLPSDKADPVTKLVDGLNEVFVKMVMVVMRAMPIFVFALMAGQIVKAAGTDPERFFSLLEFLLYYSGTLIVGLFVMIFLIYPGLISAVVKKLSYGKFLSGIRDAQITAFSTSSSVATLPVTMECIRGNLGVSKKVTSFVLPIGATVNMDGTSMYQAVAVVAMAQLHMVDLSLGQQLMIVFTATLASIGAAAIPSAGLVLMIIVLESVGLNPAWIALIFPVDRILDMCRTVVNVTGDASVATLIAYSEDELEIPDEHQPAA